MLLASITDENIIERENIVVDFSKEDYTRYKIETMHDGDYAVRIRHDTMLNMLSENKIPLRTNVNNQVIPKDIGGAMMKHYITKYEENGKRYAESWLQINAFGNCYCLWRKKIEL